MSSKGMLAIRNINTITIIFGMVLLCFIWVGLFYKVQSERQLEISNAFKDTSNYARTFEEHTLRTIKGLDLIALSLKSQLEKEGLEIDLFRLLKDERFAGQPFILLGVLNEKGDLLANSSASFVGGVNNSGREFFFAHRNVDTGKLFIGKPTVGRGSGKMSIQLSRRINKSDGSFGGVVVVSADPSYFAEYYKDINLGEDSSIMLVGRDNIIRVRRSGNEVAFGQDFSKSNVMQRAQERDTGSFIGASPVDSIDRIYSYRALREYPLLVVAGVSETQVLKGFNQRVLGYCWICGVLSLVIILFVGTLLAVSKRRRQMEEVLRESEERFRAYFQENKSVMLLVDKDTFHIVDANPAAADYYGYSLEKLKQMKISEINMLSKDDIAEKLNSAVSRSTNMFLFPHRLASGEIRQVEVYSTPIRFGQKKQLLSIVHDVTERVRLEAELRSQEEKMQSIIRGSRVGTWEWNLQTGEFDCNEQWAETAGYTKAELQPISADTWKKLIHPEDLAKNAELLQNNVWREGGYYSRDARLKHKNGQWIWIYLCSSVKEWDSTGQPLKMCGTHIDITERKQAEEALQRSSEIQSVLREIVEAASTLPSLEELYATVNRLTNQVLPSDIFHLALFDENNTQIVDGYSRDTDHYVAKRRPVAKGLTEYTLKQRKAIHVTADELQRLQECGEVIRQSNSFIHEWLGAPLFSSSGKEIGVLAVISRTAAQSFQPGDVEVLAIIAAQVSMAIERRQAEAFLKSNEEKYRLLVENSHDIIYMLSPEGEFIYVSPAWTVLLGYPVSQVTGQSFQQFVHPDDIPRCLIWLQEILATGQRQEGIEYRVRHIGGTWRWHTSSGVPIKDETGTVIHFYGIAKDITARKQAEAELQQLSTRLELATRAGGVGIWDYDVVNNVLVWDEQMFALYGIEAKAFNGAYEAWRAGLHPEDELRGDSEIQLALRGEKEFDTEFRVVWPDGTVRNIRALASVQRDEAGRSLRMIGTNWDITDQKKNEEIIRANQARYQALVEQSSEALAVIDVQTQEVVEVNRRFTEMLGYSLPEDAPLFVNKYVVDSQKNLDKIYATLNQQRVLPMEARIFRHKNGTEVYVERAATAINIAGRDYNLASMRDMTAERRRQAELARDVELASRVQMELLPKLPEIPGVDFRALYHPVNVVSGDSYYLDYENDSKLLHGFLINITGHGMGTAIQTASFNVLLREASLSQLSLVEQMQWLNARASKYFSEGSYATLLGFELDFHRRELRYVGAGISKFFINGREILTPGMFVGMFANAEFETGVLPIAAGDCLHFLTDGFTDALAQPENAGFWSPDGKDFAADVAALERLAESGRLRDDATGICFKINV